MIDYSLMYNVNMVTNGKLIWHFAEKTGFVMEIEIATGRMECLFYIPNLNNEYRILSYCNNQLFVLPYNSNIMYVYDLDIREVTRVSLTMSIEKCLCTGCAFFNDELYIYGQTQYIYKYHTENKKVTSVLDVKVQCEDKKIMMRENNWFWTKPVIYANKLFLLMYRNGATVVDNEDGMIYLPLGNEDESWVLKEMSIDNDIINVLCTDSKSNTTYRTYNLQGDELSCTKMEYNYQWVTLPYLRAEWNKRGWILFPYLDASIRYFDALSCTLTVLYTSINTNTKHAREYFSAETITNNSGDHYWLIDLARGSLMGIDAVSLGIAEKKLYFDKKGVTDFRTIFEDKAISKKHIVYEKSELETLDSYVNLLCEL